MTRVKDLVTSQWYMCNALEHAYPYSTCPAVQGRILTLVPINAQSLECGEVGAEVDYLKTIGAIVTDLEGVA